PPLRAQSTLLNEAQELMVWLWYGKLGNRTKGHRPEVGNTSIISSPVNVTLYHRDDPGLLWGRQVRASRLGSNMPVGNGLRSCTAKVTPTAPFFIDGREVILLDTPGFDDTTTPDFDTLEEIAQYMASIIADRRMGGIQERNLRIFESLCGDDPLKSAVVVTNMWGLVP
ncbi:11267_t:CDS:2, partial [Acaulospora colombiana]